MPANRIVVFLLVALAASLPTASGKTIYVDDDANGLNNGTSWGNAYRFLQDALADAKTAEKPVEIRVAQGIYKPDRDSAHPQGALHTGRIFELRDGMSLLGGYAGVRAVDPNARDFKSYLTILSGDLLGNDAPVTDPAKLKKDDPTRKDNCRVMSIGRYGDGHIRLEGCVVAGGFSTAVQCWAYEGLSGDADVVVSDCTFRDNVGDYRADFLMATALEANSLDGPITVTRCSFVSNAGGLSALCCAGVVSNCQFTRNYAWSPAGRAGGACLDNSRMADCTFTENRAEVSGGALELSGANTISRCVFRYNSCVWEGGAIRCHDGNSELRDCYFAGNSAGGGGGVCFQSGGSVTAIGCVFVGNRSGYHGGVWLNGLRGPLKWQSPLNMVNCTASGNRSIQEGCFIAANPYSGADSGPFRVLNCILADGGTEIWGAGSPVEVAYTCFLKGGADVNDPNGWLAWGPGNIVADPCFAKPGYWDPNDTPDDPNDDYFVEGDYHLKSQAGRWDPNSKGWVMDSVTSPCIDAGDPNSPVGDEPEPNGGRINMGAYGGTAEASKSYSPVSLTAVFNRSLWRRDWRGPSRP
jgi:hypothetical protein